MFGVRTGSLRKISTQHDVQQFAFRMLGIFSGRFQWDYCNLFENVLRRLSCLE